MSNYLTYVDGDKLTVLNATSEEKIERTFNDEKKIPELVQILFGELVEKEEKLAAKKEQDKKSTEVATAALRALEEK